MMDEEKLVGNKSRHEETKSDKTKLTDRHTEKQDFHAFRDRLTNLQLSITDLIGFFSLCTWQANYRYLY